MAGSERASERAASPDASAVPGDFVGSLLTRPGRRRHREEGGGGGERKGERGDQERVRSRGEAGRGGGERRVAGARGAPDCGRGEEGLGVSWRPRHAPEAFTAAASKGTLAPLPLTSAPLSPSLPPSPQPATLIMDSWQPRRRPYLHVLNPRPVSGPPAKYGAPRILSSSSAPR